MKNLVFISIIRISLLGSALVFASCTQTQDPSQNCSSITSTGDDDSIKLRLGGAIEIVNPDGTIKKCTALFGIKGIHGASNIEVTTARHCIDPQRNANVNLRIYDGSGYLSLSAKSKYLTNISIINDIIRRLNLDPLMNGVFSEKSGTQLFTSYHTNLGASVFNTTMSRQLKEENAALGAPLCSTLSKSPNKTLGSTKTCFLYSDLIRFNVEANIGKNGKLALYRAIKLGANIELSKANPELENWNKKLMDHTEAEIKSFVTTIKYAAGICTGKIEVPSGHPFEAKKELCDLIPSIKEDLLSNGITDEFKGEMSEVLGKATAITYAHEKFEDMAKAWHNLKPLVFNKNFVLMGNNKNPKSGDLAFGSTFLSRIPTSVPNIHRSYGIVSHFDNSRVIIEKGASGSLLMVEGNVIAILASVNGDDTSTGIAQALPESIPVEIPAPVDDPVSPVTGIDVPIEGISSLPDDSVSKPSSVTVSESDVPSDLLNARSQCGT
jgi:hypothetical protein